MPGMWKNKRSVTDCAGPGVLAALCGPSARSSRVGKAPRKPNHRVGRAISVKDARAQHSPVSWVEMNGGQKECLAGQRLLDGLSRGKLSTARRNSGAAKKLEYGTSCETEGQSTNETEDEKVEQVVQALMMTRHGVIPSPVQSESPKKKKLRMKVPQMDRSCDYCGTSATAQWRSGPPNFPVLCNACGVRHRKGKLKIRGGQPYPQKSASDLQVTVPVASHPSLSPVHVPKEASEGHCSLGTTTPKKSCMERSSLGKRTRSASISCNSEQSGHVVGSTNLAKKSSSAVVVASPLPRNKFLCDEYCFGLRWGAKRRRSGWD
ncbi:hypothetical protein BSKO_03542 [Bryopsis sp. KO-2023]|nr:hypothetical protein BSKO_03542 [Bryopsis sp. KO-2023]